MIKYEELEKQLKNRLLIEREIWAKSPTETGKNEVAKIDNIFANFPEYVRQHIAKTAREVVKIVSEKASRYLETKPTGEVDTLGIVPNDPILGLVNRGIPYGTQQSEEVIQKIYESFGYTDKLITLPELRKLEAELKHVDFDRDPQKYSDINAEIEIAKNHAGMKLEGHNFYTDDVIAEWAANLYRASIEASKSR